MKAVFAITNSLTGLVVTAVLSICVPTYSLAGEFGDTGEEVYEETCNRCHGLITQESSWIEFVPEDGSEVQLAVILARGPTLNGIVNRPVAIVDGYRYSGAMKELAATGAVWDRENLNSLITDSRAMVKGYMALRLPEEDRKLVLDYLTSVALYQP